MSIDLHIHSIHSDGTLHPTEIVRLARESGLTAIAITDHDTISGVEEGIRAGGDTGLEVVSGVEFSVQDNDTPLHLLGYFFDSNNSELNRVLGDVQSARKERNRQIIKKLCNQGLELTLEEVDDASELGQTGRPHIARVLVEKGYTKSIDEAFYRYLRKGASCHVSRKVLDAVVAIQLIRQAGGLAVLAHPISGQGSLQQLPGVLGRLVPIGLAGIEVYYPSHSKKDRKKLNGIASRYDLVVSGGSDYHGDIRPGTSLAGSGHMQVPAEVLQHMKKRL